MKIDFKNSITSGILATGVMDTTAILLALLGAHSLGYGFLIKELIGVPLSIAWFTHLISGGLLGFIFINFFFKKNGANPLIQGMFFGMLTFVFVQVSVLPILGLEPFSDQMHVIGSLFSHTTFGALVSHLAFGAILPLNNNNK